MARTTIPAELVAINAIQGTLIADNAITAVHIATNAVSGTLVADNAITSTHIAQNNVTATQIAQNTITVTQIADSAIETAKINNGAVTQAKIADDAIGPNQLAENAVVSASIANGTIVEADMADNAVTLAKMAGLARGSIIVGDSAGDPSALAIGSNGTVLKSDGTDVSWGAAGGTTINNNADNRIITGSGTANTLEGESSLTYDGNTLTADYDLAGFGTNIVSKNTNNSSIYSRGSGISFQVSNGSATKNAAIIKGGRQSTTSGGYLYFETADSSWNTPAERMKIDNVGDITMSGTGSLTIPKGTTAQRPSSPAAGMMRYNTTESKFEVYNSMWLPMKTEAPLSFQQASTYHRKWTIAADGQSAQAGSGYSAISVNLNFEGNFTIITKWSHDYMGVGIGYKAGITNSNFTGESGDANGPYGGGTNVDGFDSTVSYMGTYHWPISNGGGDDNQTTWYIKHQRAGNTISTHYSTNSASATNPSHSSWSQVQSATISSTDHCKPLWGEASGNESVALTLLYNDITGGFNGS